MNPKIVHGRYGLFVAYDDDEYLGQAICEYGEYGNEEADFLLSLCDKDSHIIEVGANAGYLTIPLASRYNVIAIEPQPSPYGLLVANVFLNKLYERVMCCNYACGEKDSMAYIPLIEYEEAGNHGAIPVSKEAIGRFQTMIQVKRLDDVIGSPISMMKIDVEGMELEVLKGAAGIIEKYKPVLYVENDRKEKSQALVEYVWSLGYECTFHTPLLFNPANHNMKLDNLWPNVASHNMVCTPKEQKRLQDPIKDSRERP